MKGQNRFALIIIALVLPTFQACGCNGGNESGVEVVPFDDVQFEICDDEEDNDDDGRIDCLDTQCQRSTHCRFEPPSPKDLAPKTDALGISSFWESNRFLVEGDQAIVRNVALRRLQKNSVSVIRARLIDHDDHPLPGVRANIVNHPEYGYTFTRADGEVDFLVNSNTKLILRFDDDDMLPVDVAFRPSPNTYEIGREVVLSKLDTLSTRVDENTLLSNSSVIKDDEGERQLRVFFNSGTKASTHLDDGRIAVLDSFTLRASEYTTGKRGVDAMPF